MARATHIDSSKVQHLRFGQNKNKSRYKNPCLVDETVALDHKDFRMYVLKKDCPRTNDDATSRLLDGVSQSPLCRNGLTDRNLKTKMTAKILRRQQTMVLRFSRLCCVHFIGLRDSNMS